MDSDHGVVAVLADGRLLPIRVEANAQIILLADPVSPEERVEMLLSVIDSLQAAAGKFGLTLTLEGIPLRGQPLRRAHGGCAHEVHRPDTYEERGVWTAANQFDGEGGETKTSSAA